MVISQARGHATIPLAHKSEIVGSDKLNEAYVCSLARVYVMVAGD